MDSTIMFVVGFLVSFLLLVVMGAWIVMIIYLRKVVQIATALKEDLVPMLSSQEVRHALQNIGVLAANMSLGVRQMKALTDTFTSFTQSALENPPSPVMEPGAAGSTQPPGPTVGEPEVEFVAPTPDAAAYTQERVADGGPPEEPGFPG